MKAAGTYKITRQGQITLPSEARKELGLKEGDLIDLFYTRDLIVVRKRKTPIAIFEDLATKTTSRFKEEKITPEILGEEIAASRKVRERK
ncbi:MAG: AbrB/MazE/SpoVT family DNA-binding domain-containing protein [Promethearchaeota archaeon]